MSGSDKTRPLWVRAADAADAHVPARVRHDHRDGQSTCPTA